MVENTSWSAATRAAIVLFWVERLIRFWRNWYHFVAAGPKTAVPNQHAYFESRTTYSFTSSIEGHAACSQKVVVFDTLLVDDLLREDIAGSKQNLRTASGGRYHTLVGKRAHRRRQRLRENRPCGNLSLIPPSRSVGLPSIGAIDAFSPFQWHHADCVP